MAVINCRALRYQDTFFGASNATSNATDMTFEGYRVNGRFVLPMTTYDQDNKLYVTFQLNHNARRNAKVHDIHVHCIPMVDPAGACNVYWRINYRWCGIGDTFDAPTAWATKQTIMALAAGDGFKHKYHELVTDADIALPATYSVSTILLAEVIREGATEAGDNFHDAKTEAVPPYTAKCNLALLGIDAHILVDSDGSENDTSY